VLVQHEFGIFGGVHGEFVLELLAGLRTPYLVTLHTTEAHAAPQRLEALGLALRGAEAVVAMADDGCDVVAGWAGAYGLPPLLRPCLSVPHGIPEPPRCGGEWQRAALGLAPGAVLILSGGLLGPGKGIEALIAAMPAVLEAQPDALLLVVGAPHPSDAEGGAYVRRLWAQAAALRPPAARARVLFAPGYLPTERLQRLYAAAHIFVAYHSSRAQRSSGTLAAAVGAGAAGVATRFPAAQELLGQGRGLLLPFDRPDVLAASIAALAAEPARCAAMGAAGAAHVAGRTWRRTGERYANVSAAAAASAGAARRREQEGGGRGWPEAATAGPAGRLGAGAENGLLRVFTVSNPGWVDGQGPGWAAVDTWVARRRRGWGQDAALLKGAFLVYDAPPAPPPAGLRARLRAARRAWRRAAAPPPARTLRLFEGAATRSEAAPPPPGYPPGAACLLQRWSGGLPGYPEALAEANRTLCVAPRSEEVMLSLSAAVRQLPDARLRAAARGGAPAPLPPRLRVTSSLDQLSVSGGEEAYFRWRLRAPAAARDAQPHARALLPFAPDAALRLESADSRGCATQLTVRAASAAARLDAQLDEHVRPHSVTHTFEAAAGGRRVEGAVWLRWAAEQAPTAPALCTPLLDADGEGFGLSAGGEE